MPASVAFEPVSGCHNGNGNLASKLAPHWPDRAKILDICAAETARQRTKVLERRAFSYVPQMTCRDRTGWYMTNAVYD